MLIPTLGRLPTSPALEFKTGSQAVVKAQFFRTTQPSKKLSEKFLGLYKIIAQPRSHSITLQLPDSLRAVHLVFHISMLEPAFPNTIPVQPPPPPVMVNHELEFEISEILDTKINTCRHACKLLYLVHWTGYEGTDEETLWILASELGHTSELIMEFHTKYPTKPGPSVATTQTTSRLVAGV